MPVQFLVLCVEPWLIRLSRHLSPMNLKMSRVSHEALKLSLCCRVTGFTIPLAHGRGFFYGSVGLLPFQEPINVVVGAPMAVEQYTGDCVYFALSCLYLLKFWHEISVIRFTCHCKCVISRLPQFLQMVLCEGDMRSEEAVKIVDKYHQLYIQGLTDLYNAHKDSYFQHRWSDMCLAE